MPNFIKNTVLNYIPNNFETERYIKSERIFDVNNNPIKNGNILYLCEREIRTKDNFAVQFAFQKSKELNLPLKIVHPKIIYEYLPKQKFIDKQISMTKTKFSNIGLV